MSISYHGIIGSKGKTTLPSVSSWGSNMNILRDPPRGIETRRIDRVGQDSKVLQMIQESGDRSCENISTYAKGVNPMVSVSYDNYGNNGGRSSTVSGQAFLPYRIMNAGAFRPPARDQRELLPLSRLPRTTTSSFTQPGFADFSKKAMCPGLDYERGIRKESKLLKPCAEPNLVYRIVTPGNYEITRVIKNPISVQAHSGKNDNKRVVARYPSKPTKEIQNALRVEISGNLSGEQRDGENKVYTEKYTRENFVIDHESQKSRNLQVTPLTEQSDLNTNDYIKTPMNIRYGGSKISYDKQNYIHGTIRKDRKIPVYLSNVNAARNIHVTPIENQNIERSGSTRIYTSANTNLGTADRSRFTSGDEVKYSLKSTINAGSYVPNVGLPEAYHENRVVNFDQDRNEMRNRVYKMQQERYSQ